MVTMSKKKKKSDDSFEHLGRTVEMGEEETQSSSSKSHNSLKKLLSLRDLPPNEIKSETDALLSQEPNPVAAEEEMSARVVPLKRSNPNCSVIWRYTWRVIRRLSPIILLALYTMLGALMFAAIEREAEMEAIVAMHEKINATSQEIPQEIAKIVSISEEQVNETMYKMFSLLDAMGVGHKANTSSKGSWTITGSIYYCVSIYTTIGYGNIAPITPLGRGLTIVYALIGIFVEKNTMEKGVPLLFYCIILNGQFIAYLCSHIWKAICVWIRRMKHVESLSEREGSNRDAFPISVLLAVTLWSILFIAWRIMDVNDWDYGTSLYFSLISITTIGLGDIVAKHQGALELVELALYILVALSLFSAMTNMIGKQIEDLAEDIKHTIDREYKAALSKAKDVRDIESADALQFPKDIAKYESHTYYDSQTVKAVASRMPWKWRMLYYCMPNGKKKQLGQRSEAYVDMRSIGTQTEATKNVVEKRTNPPQ